MLDESRSEISASVELSPSELLVQISERVDAIIEDTTKSPDLYFGVKTVTSDTGIEVSSLCASRSGAGIKRSHNQETGTTAYELSELYHHGLDRGAFVYCWSTLGSGISFSFNSEMNGENEPVLKTDRADMVALQKMIEGYFPKPELESTKQTLAQRVLALLRK